MNVAQATAVECIPSAVCTHHVLDARVLFQRVQGKILAVAGLLEPPVRHLAGQRNVGVEPDGTEGQFPGHAFGTKVIAGPDAGGQTILHAVGLGDGVIIVIEGLHGDDRAKDHR